MEAWAVTSGLDTFTNSVLISVQKISVQAMSCHLFNFLFTFYLPCAAWFVLLITLDQQKVYFKLLRVSFSSRLLFKAFSLFGEIFALKLPHWVKNDRKAKWCFGMDETARLKAQLHKWVSALLYANRVSSRHYWHRRSNCPVFSLTATHPEHFMLKTLVQKQEALLDA